MTIYLQSIDYDLWDAIFKGPHVPSKRFDSRSVVEKTTDEWGEQIRKLCSTNVKAMNIFTVV